VQRVHRAGVEPGGTVIGQTPAAGTALAQGATMRLVLSDGSLVRVPRVAGLALADARQRLAGSELKIVTNNATADAPAGTVLNQRPADGEIAARGSSVRVTVSSGPAAAASLTVPNVVGLPFERAQSQLARFRIERSERGAREPAGTVLEQVPAAGSTAPAGSAIAIIVSSGGRPEAIEVPDVVAQPIDAATTALSEFRVERETVPSVEPAGRVLAQEPAAGASVAPGSTVHIRVADGALVPTPNLTQLRLAQARATAQASGLTLDAGADADDTALVLEQQPAAGTPVARGAALRVTLQASQFALIQC
jgi:serine/threonine-protein kinase